MLPVSFDAVRIFLHVLAACVWVGGQIVMAGLVPVLRGISPDAPRLAAHRFGLVAWGAYAVVVVTGIWNLMAVGTVTAAYQSTVGVKFLLVIVAGILAWVHQKATSPGLRGASAGLGLLASLGALFLGVLLG